MNLHIILRTHDGKNIHGKRQRYISVPKKELVIGCVSSLVNSANKVSNHKIHFTILDDHSTEELIDSLHDIFSQSIHSWNFIQLKEKGFNHSALKQFEYCKESKADIVYSVEDDYLHYPTSIGEMIDAYLDLKRKYELDEVCIFPFDCPYESIFNYKDSVLITRGKKRHWRSTTWTTQTFMTSPKVFRDYWSHFEKLAREFKVVPREQLKKIIKKNSNLDDIVWESTTIGNIWRNYVMVFNPIPSLALHVQFYQDRDPYINHLDWWYRFSKIDKLKMSYL